MARRTGSTTEASYKMKLEVLTLREQGLGYGTIAKEIGVSKARIQQICKQAEQLPAYNPQEILQHCINLKAEKPNYGAMQIRRLITHQYYKDIPSIEMLAPSENKLEKIFKNLSLTRQKIGGKNKRPYWFDENGKPSVPGILFQIDTVEFRDKHDKKYIIMTITDMVSHIVHAEIIPSGSGKQLAWGIQRAFQVMGIPAIVQSDNGSGMVCGTRNELSHLIKTCFNYGAQEYRFIPLSEASKNGNIERFHRSMREAWRQDREHSNSFTQWLDRYLIYYNTIKPHSELGRAKKGERKSPAEVGTYNYLLPSEDATIEPTETEMYEGKKVSYIRVVNHMGIAQDKTPNRSWRLTPSLFGNYVAIEYIIGDATGRIITRERDEDDKHWQPPRVIGTFEHQLGIEGAKDPEWIEVKLGKGNYKPLPYEVEMEEKRLKRNLRHGAISFVSNGYQTIEGEDGTWRIVDKETGEIVLSDETPRPYHWQDLGEIQEAA